VVWGHQVAWLESLQQQHGITPKALLERPEVHDLGGETLDAFYTLSSSRAYGMGGPLAVSIEAMFAYCQMFGVESLDDRTDFLHTMQRLDKAYLAAVAEREDKKTDTAVVDQGIPMDNPPKG
jgi:hypothetical protein